MKSKLTVTGANLVLFTFAVLWFSFQVVLLILSAKFGESFITNNIYGALLINQYVIILFPILIYAGVKRLNLKSTFRFNKIGPVPLLLIIAISIPAYFVFAALDTIVVFLLQFIGDIPPQPIPIPKNAIELLIGILVLAVSPAICEEMLHRGLMLRAYENRGSIKAIAITSIIFGFFHFDIKNLIGPIFLGFILGYYVVKTNSIFAGMFAHFLNNTIAEVLQFIGKDVPVPQKLTVSPGELGSVAVLGFICLIVVFLLLKLFSYATEGIYEMKPSLTSIRNDFLSIATHWPIIAVFVLYILMQLLFIMTIIITRVKGLP